MSRIRPFLLTPWMIVASASLASAAQTSAPSTCPPAAQQPSPSEIAELAKNAKDHGFLWKATKDGKTSYLYGTIHVGRTDWMFPGPVTMSALRGTDAIALELDMMDPSIVQRLQAGMAPRAGAKLPSKLDERLKTQLKAACLPDQLT
ncbi:MAG: TraB/GumN family protein, partial [Vicinamibacteria bacterium]